MRGLTDLQGEILRRFFAVRQDFFLTGGAALAGFHLHHRATHDLDLFANKLCTLLSRAEIRDLVDVAMLAKAGHDPIAAVPAAARKDGGMSASQLAWILSSFPVPLDESLLHGVSREELLAFRDDLVRRLTALAFPGSTP